MKSSLCGLLGGLLVGVTLLSAGCGEQAAKVDLAAQINNLAGDADAKATALSEIASVGAGAASAVPKIIPLLKDADPIVRRTAAYALGAIGPAARAAVPDLKEMLNAADRDQLTAVANALRSIDPNAVPGLRVDNVTN
jgi:HEAT repeat protein